MPDQNVINFIDKFRSSRDLFMHGMCYWFAHILSTRFNGEICIHEVDCHFCARIKGVCYDATGCIDGNGFINWGCYQILEPYRSERLIRDCV